VLRYVEDGHERFLVPLGEGPIDEALDWCVQHLVGRGHAPRIGFVPDPLRERLDPSRWVAETDPDNDDYVYRREDLATLAGGRYSRKRNFVKRFQRHGDWSLDPLASADPAEVRGFLREWCAANECDAHPDLADEVNALGECLSAMDRLDLFGGVLRSHGRVIGLTLGEALNRDTFVVHYEKALLEREGAYQMLCHEFTKRIPEQYAWIDREQDMGSDSLRQAKESWFPDHRVKAWTISPK
jgi:hypothetical protein